jgi:hypothetical protein
LISLSTGGLLGCAAEEPAQSRISAALECDTEWVCGSNSPEIDHYGFHELHLEGLKNLQGFEIISQDGLAQIYKGGVGHKLKVLGSRIYGFDSKGNVTLSGTGLVGAEIRLLHHGAASYTIRIESVRPIYYALGSQEDPFEAYSFSWFDNGNPPDGKRLICEPPTLLPEPLGGSGLTTRSASRPPNADELFGMRPGETVVFEGDRIDSRNKMFGTTFNTTWINFGCAGHTLAKLHLTRHTRASNSEAYGITHMDRQATLKMMVADYCGDGTPFTVAGERVRWKGGLMGFYTTPSSLEARWTSQGAACLGEPRLERTSSPLADQLFGPDIAAAVLAHCPNLPRCKNNDVNNFDGSLRVSGNP